MSLYLDRGELSFRHILRLQIKPKVKMTKAQVMPVLSINLWAFEVNFKRV